MWAHILIVLFGNNLVKVNAIGQLAAVLVFAVPGVFGNVGTNMQWAHFVLCNFLNHYAAYGHNPDAHVIGHFTAGNGKQEFG